MSTGDKILLELGILSGQHKELTGDISEIKKDLKIILDPETGVYPQIKDICHEVSKIKGTYKYVIAGAVFVGFAMRDIGVRILSRVNGG